MKLSFITIANGIEELKYTLDSISKIDFFLKNEYKQIIVIPRETDYESSSFLDKLKKNRKILVCNDEKKGIYAALNIGIAKAIKIKSTHIAFINGGDLLQNGFCKSIEMALVNPLSIIGGYNRIVSERYEKEMYIYKGGRNSWNINHQGSIYPISVFLKYKYFENLKISADWHLNYILRNKYNFRLNQSIVANFKFGGISSGKKRYIILLNDEISFMKSNFWEYFNVKNVFYIVRFVSILFRFLLSNLNNLI